MEKHYVRIFYSPWFYFILALIVFAPLLWLNPIPANDTATRYAPMADAFVRGEFHYAYHPRFGILFPTLSGIIAYLSGLDGFRSCQIAALGLWALAIFPLYKLFKIIWDEKVAVAGVILYLLCSHLHRYFYDGLRDNGRTLGLGLLAVGMLEFYYNRQSVKALFTALAGGLILSFLRADGVIIALGGFCFITWLDLAAHHWRCYRSVILALFFVILLSPQLYLNYQWHGYFVPYSRYGVILEKLGFFPNRSSDYVK